MYKIGAFENTCYCRKVVFTRHLKKGEISRNQKKLHFQKIFFFGYYQTLPGGKNEDKR